MRFSTAIGVLAQLVASTRADKKAALWPQMQNRRQRVSHDMMAFPTGREQKNDSRSGNEAMGSKAVECDPTSSDPDVGILSCGFGKYCQESKEYGLGGVCADEPTTESHRQLQSGANVDIIVSLCDPTSTYYGIYDCDCALFDVENTSGFLECIFFENFCFDPPADTTCATTILEADFTSADVYSIAYCYDFTTPYDQSVCYNYSSDGSCTLDFNDMRCNSCTKIDVEGDPEQLYCLDFDCTNTDGMHQGSQCDGDFVAKIVDGIEEGTPTAAPAALASCSVCPGDVPVTNPDTVLSLGDLSATCAEVQQFGLLGLIPSDLCPAAQAAVPGLCGCGEVATPTDSPESPVAPPTDSPVTEPTMPPVTDAPVTAPPPPTEAPAAAPSCSVCPDDVPVTNPDIVLNLGDLSATCAEVQQFGLLGLIPSALCPAAQAAVPGLCGCGAAPTDSPVAVPTMPPVENPVAVPTLMPVLDMSMSMGDMSMSMGMGALNRRELDALLDSEFGQGESELEKRDLGEFGERPKRMRKRVPLE